MKRKVEEADVFDRIPELGEGSAHAAAIDYPWEFDADNGKDRFGKETRDFDKYDLQENDGMIDVLEEVARIVTEGGWVFVFADDEVSPVFRRMVEESPLKYRRTLVWDRGWFGMGYYHRVQHYPIIAATNGETERYVKDRGTVFRTEKGGGRPQNREYATGKPAELYKKMLAPPVLHEGEKLIEPFCGSAPGAEIAARRGLEYWGCDTNPEAVRMAEQKLKQARWSRWE